MDPVVAPPPGEKRFPLIDSMRGIAALCVLVTHAAAVSGETIESPAGKVWAQLTVGVPIFFLVSGFLLYRPYFSARYHGYAAPSARTFFRRRILRIVPAYWAALLVLAIGLTLSGVLTSDWWVYFGFLQAYQRDTVLQGIAPAWSLCVEVTFYLVLPVYAVLVARFSRRMTKARMVWLDLAVLGVLGGAAVAARTWAAAADETLWFQTLPTTFDWFALGMALAVISVAYDKRALPRVLQALAARPGACWLGAIAAFLAMCLLLDLPLTLVGRYTPAQVLVQHLTFGLVALLLMLPAVFDDDAGGVPRRLLAWPTLAWLGTISYGIFLYNLTLCEWLQGRGVADWLPGGRFPPLVLVTFLASVAAATVSYYGLERPILRLKYRGRT